MPSLEEVLGNYQDDQIFLPKTQIDPEDNATIIFTSGTWTLSNIILPIRTDYFQERPVCQKAFLVHKDNFWLT